MIHPKVKLGGKTITGFGKKATHEQTLSFSSILLPRGSKQTCNEKEAPFSDWPAPGDTLCPPEWEMPEGYPVTEPVFSFFF